MAVVIRPVVGLRSGPRSQSELLTQEVWGRPLRVTGRRGDWLRCEAGDGMTGYIPASSVAAGEDYIPTHVVAKRFAMMTWDKGGEGVMLPMGSLVAVEGLSGGRARVRAADGAGGALRAGDLARLAAGAVGPQRPAGLAGAKAIVDRLVPEVVGTPYLWGGRSTFGFDCSGLVQVIFEFLGIGLPRDSRDQAAKGRRLGGLGRLRPLDLVFFGRGGRIEHVALHMSGLGILHASGHVRLESLDPESPGFRKDLRERFAWATRLIR
jgi:hypothetical protein